MFKERNTEAKPSVPSDLLSRNRSSRLTHPAHRVELQVSFGKDEHFWTNVFPTQLLEKHAKEIKRFKWAIKIMRWFELFCEPSFPVRSCASIGRLTD